MHKQYRDPGYYAREKFFHYAAIAAEARRRAYALRQMRDMGGYHTALAAWYEARMWARDPYPMVGIP